MGRTPYCIRQLRYSFAVLLLCVVIDSCAVRTPPNLLKGKTPESQVLGEVADWFSKVDWNQKLDAISTNELEADLQKSGLHLTAALLSGKGSHRSQAQPAAKLTPNSTVSSFDSEEGPYMPVVQMHGMGDFSISPGMVQIRKAISNFLNGTYVKSAKVGATMGADSRNTFFTTMDEQIEYFAKEGSFKRRPRVGAWQDLWVLMLFDTSTPN
eukprot:1175994-Prorocentrum_minimum.AAC.3